MHSIQMNIQFIKFESTKSEITHVFQIHLDLAEIVHDVAVLTESSSSFSGPCVTRKWNQYVRLYILGSDNQGVYHAPA